MLYVLIITTFVANGSTYTMQEFANKQSCENAIEVLKSKNPVRFRTAYAGGFAPADAFCVPKDITVEVK